MHKCSFPPVVFFGPPHLLFGLLAFCFFVPGIASAQKPTQQPAQRGWGSNWTDSHTLRDEAARTWLKKIAADLKAKNEQATERDLDGFLKQFPQLAKGRMLAAGVHVLLHRFDRALQDCDVALRLVREDTPLAAGEIYEMRAQIHLAMRDYRAAHADFEQALTTNKQNYMVANDLAWFLATCPAASERDGRRAVKLARTASASRNDREGSLLDTLAAAEAEVSDFDSAVRDEKQAMKSLKKVQMPGAQKRLQLYLNHQAYREQVPPFSQAEFSPKS